jgi:hypothetical protein
MSIETYSAELRAQASRVLEAHPGLTYAWDELGALRFAACADDGFEVTLAPEGAGIIVFTSVGFHEHCEGETTEAVQSALGLARDLLSPDMRIREQRAGGRPYRWRLERRHASGWTVESKCGLLFWNYLGRRSQCTYQNHHLPGRLVPGGGVSVKEGDGGYTQAPANDDRQAG